jgi:hypothetical protein
MAVAARLLAAMTTGEESITAEEGWWSGARKTAIHQADLLLKELNESWFKNLEPEGKGLTPTQLERVFPKIDRG